ncbi:MAG: ribosome maturation factor RimM [Proteobacteria bacterium]|nr:ribosome maturation factor RimM [Pseudomonadota bacterium]MBU1058044.1 ribosome maturation factor RimM [Pseudomonadota bacterium]
MTDSFSFPTDDYVLIGKITKAHGLKGEVKIMSFSGRPQNISQYRHVVLVSEQGRLTPPFTVVRSRPSNKEAIVVIEGINDRSHAEGLSGYGVLVRKDELPQLKGDEFYLHELQGLHVTTDEGVRLGTVQAFLDNGAQDILVIRKGNDEFLIPLIPGMIVERNKEAMIIAPPPGLIDINCDEKN